LYCPVLVVPLPAASESEVVKTDNSIVTTEYRRARTSTKSVAFVPEIRMCVWAACTLCVQRGNRAVFPRDLLGFTTSMLDHERLAGIAIAMAAATNAATRSNFFFPNAMSRRRMAIGNSWSV
jgi:hypothetical protein